MRGEIKSAVDFVANLLRCRKVDRAKLDVFRQTLHLLMCAHYQDHWFPEKPFKGSGYRCMRIVNHKMDPLIGQAGLACGFSENDMLAYLPSELTVWVDPEEVSYRIGEDGSIGVLFGDESDELEEEQQQQQQPQDILQVCKDQLRCYFPTSQDGINLEHLATVVTS